MIYRKNLLLIIFCIFFLSCNSGQCGNTKVVLSNKVITRINFGSNGVDFSGIDAKILPQAGTYEVVPGPYEGMQALKTKDIALTVQGDLKKPLSKKGSIILWFKTPEKAELESTRFIIIKEFCTIGFDAKDYPDNCISMYFKWSSAIKGVDPIRVLIPSIPADTWINLAFCWDSKAGIFNAYINGDRKSVV